MQGSSVQCFMDAAPAYELLHVEFYNAILVRRDLLPAFPEIAGSSTFEKWAMGYFCRPASRTLWHREARIIAMGADPRFWADTNRSLVERGENILRCLRHVRRASP